MKKNPISEKTQRKSEIGRMALVATLVDDIIENSKHGVISLQQHLDARDDMKWSPGVHLQPKLFMELFGDDTEYEYIDGDYGKNVVTNVNGVTFYALINGMDLIRDGRLV